MTRGGPQTLWAALFAFLDVDDASCDQPRITWESSAVDQVAGVGLESNSLSSPTGAFYRSPGQRPGTRPWDFHEWSGDADADVLSCSESLI